MKGFVGIGLFILGAAAGALGMWVYEERKVESRLNMLEDEYQKLRNGLAGRMYDSTTDKETAEEERPAKPETAKDMAEKGRRDPEKDVPYHEMYANAEIDDEADREYDDETLTDEQLMHEEHERFSERPPHVVSWEEYEALNPFYNKYCWFYYALDGIVTDEEGNVIEDEELFLGDCLDEMNLMTDEEWDVAYVVNHQLDTAYCIQRFEEAYCDRFGADE